MGAANITFCTDDTQAFNTIQGFFDCPSCPSRPVSTDEFAVYSVCMKTVVQNNHTIRTLSVKAQNIDTLIQFTKRMVDVGVVDRRTGECRTVFHPITTYVGNSIRRMSNSKAHARRLHISQSQYRKIA